MSRHESENVQSADGRMKFADTQAARPCVRVFANRKLAIWNSRPFHM